MALTTISPKSSIAELLSRWPEVIPVFLKYQMSCPGCSMSAFETLEDASQIYNVNLDQLIDELSVSVTASIPPTGEVDLSKLSTDPIKEHPMTAEYTFFEDIQEAINAIPTESIVSRTIFRDDNLKSIVFAFAPGQELSEHTASVPAIIHILDGECELTLGKDSYSVKGGAWARLPANMPHSIFARTPVKMLLLMLP